MSRKKIWISLVAVIVAALFIGACSPAIPAFAAGAVPQNPAQGRGAGGGRGIGAGGQGMGRGGGSQGMAGAGLALGPLSDAEAQALVRAIEEEYRAQALYQSVLNTFGDAYPFNRIVRAEAQHASALLRLAQKYGVTAPAYPNAADLPTFTSLSLACQAGVQAEIADAALYDELMPVVTHADLLRVFENLQSASLNNHLPTFQACQ